MQFLTTLLKRTTQFVLVILLSLILLLLFLGNTHMGLKASIQLAQWVAPGELTVASAQGKLLSQSTLQHVHYTDSDVSFSAQEIKLNWQPLQLLTGTLTIQKLHITHVTIKLYDTEEETTTQDSTNLPGWLNVQFTDIQLTQLHIMLPQLEQAIAIDKIRLNATKTGKVLRFKKLFIQAYQQQIDATGTIDLTPNSPLHITADFTPLTALRVAGTFNASGTLDDYQLHFDGILNNTSQSAIILTATGNTHQFILEQFNLDILGGAIQSNLVLNWEPLSWQIHIQAQQINPADYWPDFPESEISALLTSSGSYADVLDATVQLEQLSGHINQLALSGHVNLHLQDDTLDLDESVLNIGTNQLHFSGKISEHSSLAWRINLPDLSSIIPNITGGITITGGASGSLDNPSAQADIHITQFKLADNATLTSHLTLTAEATTANYYMTQGTLRLHIQPTHITYVLDETQQTTTLPGGQMIAHYQQASGLDVTGTVDLNQQTQITLTLQLPEFDPQLPINWQQPITASIDGTITQLAVLEPFLFDVTDISGQAKLAIRVAGTLMQPELHGNFTIDNAQLTLPHLGITPTAINVTVQAPTGSVIQLNGRLASGPGTLTLNGTIDPNQAHWPREITLQGDNFQIINTDQYQALISPNITLSGVSNTLDITGEIHIPSATIAPVDFSNVVELPDEVVFTDQQQKKQSDFLERNIDVHLILGDDVNLDILGLTGRMEGALQIVEKPQQYPRAYGELRVVDGIYTAYGQKLMIEYGRLIYAGGLIENPNLNIRASRTISSASNFATFGSIAGQQDIVVGIDVSGDAYDPVVNLFSQPDNLSDGDILSFLILGQPMSQTVQGADGVDNSELLISAVNALNIRGTSTGQITDQLQDTFGLDQFGLASEAQYDSDTDKVTRSTAFVIGKAITPKLFISYSIDILRKNTDVFRIKYFLTPSWVLQTETDGTDNAIDVLYTITRD